MTSRGDWRECANPTCRRFYAKDTACSHFYCSIDCVRAHTRLRSNPAALERGMTAMRAIDEADLYDFAHTRALLLGDS